MHLSANFGNTFHEIKNDGFKIDYKADLKIKIVAYRIFVNIWEKELIAIKAYKKLNPDYIVLLGDRFETFSAATAALIHNIPIIHLHGGELTESLIDDAFRHQQQRCHLIILLLIKFIKKELYN